MTEKNDTVFQIPTAKYDVLGIGNAIVDVLSEVEDSFLEENNMPKGNMSLISAEEADALYNKLSHCTESSGGSVANTVAALADMGIKTAYFGRVHDDNLGNIFCHDMRSLGVKYDSQPVTVGKSTASCYVCITPDAERTMNTYLGACTEFDISDIDDDIIKDSAIIYVEGYLWDQDSAKEAIEYALRIAKEHDRKIAFSLSDLFCVERHREEFMQLIQNYVDILFANEEEVVALTRSSSLEDSAKEITKYVEIAALTRSEKGVMLATHNAVEYVDADRIENVIDTTGAGDLFAAGFLYGMSKGYSLRKCARLGNRCAGEIIQQIGARSIKPLNKLVD